MRSKVIYQYICPTCKSTYIGRTKRILYHRVKEHVNGIIGQHHFGCNGNTDIFGCFTVLDWARKYKDLCVLEALYIQENKPILNKQLINGGSEHLLSLKLF